MIRFAENLENGNIAFSTAFHHNRRGVLEWSSNRYSMGTCPNTNDTLLLRLATT